MLTTRLIMRHNIEMTQQYRTILRIVLIERHRKVLCLRQEITFPTTVIFDIIILNNEPHLGDKYTNQNSMNRMVYADAATITLYTGIYM